MTAPHQARQMLIEGLAPIFSQMVDDGLYRRDDYIFTSFKNDSAIKQTADLAFFDSPIPSIESATVGVFFDESFVQDSEKILDYSFLGAPILFIDNSNEIYLYKLEGLSNYHIVDCIPSRDIAEGWKRLDISSYIDNNRNSLQFERSKSLMIQAAKSTLLDRMNALLTMIVDSGSYQDADAFEVAMLTIRYLSLGEDSTAFSESSSDKIDYARNLALDINQATSFENLPPESIAELYEAFAVTKELRKSNGVVYTPAWLAKYLVSRIPSEAFTKGREATDPSCGSGTFLVAYLERYLAENIRREPIDYSRLHEIVRGLDIDPVAVELTKLTLDFLARSVSAPLQNWNISVSDSTKNDIKAEWIIGNLPFGYRSFEGKDDLSNQILNRIFNEPNSPIGICLIVPESLSYNKNAKISRSKIRDSIQIEEIITLPENAFETAAARTMAIIGRAGKSLPEILVRTISEDDILKFQMNLYASKSFISRLPSTMDENWIFSPFNNLLSKAQARGIPLCELSDIMVGMQIYGFEDKAITAEDKGKSFLEAPDKFISWTPTSIRSLPKVLPVKDNFRRPGPWDKCDRSKIIVRSTTYPDNDGRLAAVPDNQGIWISDKFTGIWLNDSAIISGITNEALAAYLQTRFARIWFSLNNPSRKLRTSTLKQLPIPKLPQSSWARSTKLARPNSIVRPNKRQGGLFLTDNNHGTLTEWEWFNAAVEAAFNIGASDSIAMTKWLSQLK